jgi:hypothetical protein
LNGNPKEITHRKRTSDVSFCPKTQEMRVKPNTSSGGAIKGTNSDRDRVPIDILKMWVGDSKNLMKSLPH